MSDSPGQRDWRPTVFLPGTDFPMKAGLPQKEPAILARWKEQDHYDRTIEVALHHFIRAEEKFHHIGALVERTREDEPEARRLLDAKA